MQKSSEKRSNDKFLNDKREQYTSFRGAIQLLLDRRLKAEFGISKIFLALSFMI